MEFCLLRYFVSFFSGIFIEKKLPLMNMHDVIHKKLLLIKLYINEQNFFPMQSMGNKLNLD